MLDCCRGDESVRKPHGELTSVVPGALGTGAVNGERAERAEEPATASVSQLSAARLAADRAAASLGWQRVGHLHRGRGTGVGDVVVDDQAETDLVGRILVRLDIDIRCFPVAA